MTARVPVIKRSEWGLWNTGHTWSDRIFTKGNFTTVPWLHSDHQSYNKGKGAQSLKGNWQLLPAAPFATILYSSFRWSIQAAFSILQSWRADGSYDDPQLIWNPCSKHHLQRQKAKFPWVWAAEAYRGPSIIWGGALQSWMVHHAVEW